MEENETPEEIVAPTSLDGDEQSVVVEQPEQPEATEQPEQVETTTQDTETLEQAEEPTPEPFEEIQDRIRSADNAVVRPGHQNIGGFAFYEGRPDVNPDNPILTFGEGNPNKENR